MSTAQLGLGLGLSLAATSGLPSPLLIQDSTGRKQDQIKTLAVDLFCLVTRRKS